MAAPFPHHYRAALAWNGAMPAALEAPPRPAIEGDSPPEFDGTDRRWSPEHLLVSSVNLCLFLTFAGIAKKARLEFTNYRSEAEGTVEKTAEGLRFTRIDVRAELKVPNAADHARARDLLATAKRYCLVSASLKADVHLTPSIS
jgi:organic hydroperoxide reductase OsmC/OhrA